MPPCLPTDPAWFFFISREGRLGVWSVEVADGRLTRLTGRVGIDVSPFYAPHGTRIAHQSAAFGPQKRLILRPLFVNNRLRHSMVVCEEQRDIQLSFRLPRPRRPVCSERQRRACR